MRFMLLVKADESSEAGVLPSKELVAAMGTFNEEMAKTGVMLAADGLHPSSKGARVAYAGTKRTVTDGPFTETKELIAGYWVIQVESKAEAICWASRAPFQGGQVEVRQVFEASDFPSDVFPPEEAAREEALREQARRNAPKP
jgi:hypothetical protein